MGYQLAGAFGITEKGKTSVKYIVITFLSLYSIQYAEYGLKYVEYKR